MGFHILEGRDLTEAVESHSAQNWQAIVQAQACRCCTWPVVGVIGATFTDVAAHPSLTLSHAADYHYSAFSELVQLRTLARLLLGKAACRVLQCGSPAVRQDGAI